MIRFFVALAAALCASAQTNLRVSHKSVPSCDTHSQPGQSCTVQLESLHATQPAVGFWEVQCKTYRFQNMTSDELEHYLKKNPIPGVVAPDGNVYITDHHHLARALLDSNVDVPTITVTVQHNLADAGSMSAFWQQMVQLQLVWLYDDHFRAPMNPFLLPASVKQCANDPYRDLAFLVRSNGGYGKTTTPYQDFMWGALFRQHRLIPDLYPVSPPASGVTAAWGFCQTAPFNPLCYGNLTQVIMQALPEALQLASSPEASSLPGFGKGVMAPPKCGNGTQWL